MKNISMKNIGMKKNMKENIQRIWGESLKSLKSLMQIFAESANSANSAKRIFATFATFAMQIFSNLVNLVKFAMQIFHKGSYSAVRVSSVQQPTNIQRISNLSLTVRPILPLFATNSVLSRLCLVSLILMSVGIGDAWGVVTEQGSSLKQVTINGTNYHVVMESTEEHEHQYGENSSVSRDNSAPAGSLFIQMRQASGDAWVDQKEKIQCSVDGENYSDVATVNLKNKTSYEYYGPYTNNVTRATKYIRTKWDYGTKYRRYGNVYLTMASYCETITTEIDFGSDEHGAVEEETFTINWSNIADAEISITGTDASHYEIVEAKSLGNNNLGCAEGKYGYTTVTVRYKRDAVNTHNTATLSVHGVSVALKGTTVKRPNTITWAPDEVTKKNWEQSIVMTPTASNTDYANYPITLSSSNSSYASISGLTVTFHEAGADKTVTITASQATSSIYLAPVSVSRTFTIKKGQAIVWDEEVVNTFVRLNETRDIASYTYASPSGSRSITYGSADDDIISVDGTEITANAIGTVDIIATLEGDNDYNEVNSRMEFEVKNLATPVFTPDGFSEAETKALKVGESVTLVVSDVSAGLGGNFTATSDGEGTLHFTRIENVITITAYEAGDVDAVFTQTENESIFGASKRYSFTVSKNAPTITVPGNQTLDVDGEYIASTLAYSNTSKLIPDSGATDHDFYYTINHSLSTSVNKSNVVITFDPSTKKIIAQNAGTATITIYQKSVREYSEESNSFTITVNKKVTSIVGTVSPMLVGETPTISSYATSNTSAATPSDGDSNDFFYTINHTLHTPTNVTGCADGHETDVVGYDPSTHTITAYNAGTAVLTIAQKETYKYTGDTLELNVTVSKHEPVFTWNGGSAVYYYGAKIYDVFSTTGENAYSFSSSNPYAAEAVKGEKDTLLIKNVNEPATITVTQIENYKWNGKSVGYLVTPVQRFNSIPVTLTAENKTLYEESKSSYVDWFENTESGYTQKGYRMGEGAWNNRNNDVIIRFDGIPDSLYFDLHIEKYASFLPSDGERECIIYESPTSDNASYTKAWDYYQKVEWTEGCKVALKPTTRFVKFVYNGTIKCHYNNIRITAKPVLKISAETLDFGTYGAKYGEQEMMVNVDHAHAGRVTTVEIIGADASKFSVSPTTIPGTGRDLYGTTTLGVTFDNGDEVGRETPYTATLRISDNNGHSKDVTLTGTRWGKTTPVITWNPHHMPYYVGAKIYTVATSTNTDYTHSPLRYETTDADVAEVIEGKLHIHDQKSPVTISVIQDPYGEFNGARLDTTFTPYDKPNLITPLHLTKAVYDSRSITPSTDQIAWDDPSTNVIRIGNNKGPGGYGRKSFIITFGGVPDVLTFKYKTSTDWSTQSLRMNAPQWHVRESADGKTWTEIWYEEDNRENWGTITKQLSHDTRYVEFVYDGNYYGYFADINITALDGIKYMRNGDKYMSRGGRYGTQAVMDEFGVPVRVTRYTKDNDHTHDTTLVQFMDSKQYLYETNGNVYTDNVTGNNTQTRWIQTVVGNTVQVRSANGSGKYITITDGKLMMTDAAGAVTAWSVEDYTAHYDAVLKKLDANAAAAAAVDFGPEMNTLAEVRRQIKDNDFEKAPVDIEHKNDKAYENGDSRPAEGIPTVYENTISVESGFYRLTVKAMYKTAPDPVDWDNKNAGIESVVAYVFANDAYYPIKSRYDESGKYDAELSAGASIQKGGKYYANDATSAHVAFADENAYLNDVYVYVEDKGEGTGTLHYGIKNPSFVPDGSWLAYENFTLTKIARKTYYFDNNNGSGTNVWSAEDNWEYQEKRATSTPTEKNAVVIESNVEVAGEFKVYSLTVNAGKTVTIDPTGGLTIGVGGVSLGDGAQLILKAGTEGANKGQTGYLRISPEYEGAMPQATVEMFAEAYYPTGGNAVWQMVGAPIAGEGVKAKSVYSSSWVYSWDEQKNDWVNRRSKMTFEPFIGFETTQKTQPGGMTVTYNGQLVAGNEVITKNLAFTDASHGYNAMANSFAAPIDISQFTSSDFVNAEATIYILNSGTKAQSENPEDGVDQPGQWLEIPVASAAEWASIYGKPLNIPSMQGFFVRATAAGAQMKFDYSRLVWGVDYSGLRATKPLRAPQRGETEDAIGSLQVSLYANGEVDHLYFLEAEKYDAAFENGYDAHKMQGAGMNIFSVEGDDHLAVDATNSLIGTRVGVRTGEETAYTLVFSHVNSEEEMMLWDTEAEEKVEIREGGMYTFFAEPNSEITGRFIIIEAEAPEIATGISNDGLMNDEMVKAKKFIKDGQLYILKNGVLYDATGMRVR